MNGGPRYHDRVRNGSARLALASAALVMTAGGCTKVVEQAPLPPQVESTQDPLRTPTPAPRPAPRPSSGWRNESVESPPPPAPAPRPEQAPAEDKGLKREDLDKALQAVMPSLAPCFQGGGSAPTVSVKFEADPSGQAKNVSVTGASSDAQRCVTSAISGLRLPVFEGKAVGVDFPLTVYQPPPPPKPAPAAPAPAAAGAAAGQPQEPRLFLRP